MKREASRHAPLGAAATLLSGLLSLTAFQVALPPAFASDVRLHYEDTMEDVPATEASEKQIKAAFLLRFPDFVNWAKPVGDTLHVAVIGDDALLNVLVPLAEQENRTQRRARPYVAVIRVTDPAKVRPCEMLVLGEDMAQRPLPTLKAAHEAGILTVGAWNGPQGGTIIRLYRDGDRVRFDISRTLAKEAGLQISSKLLNLAANSSTDGLPRGVSPREWTSVMFIPHVGALAVRPAGCIANTVADL